MTSYAVRIDLEIRTAHAEHVLSYASRLSERLPSQESVTIQHARSLFHAKPGPRPGITRVTVSAQGRDQGTAISLLRAMIRIERHRRGGWLPRGAVPHSCRA